MFQLWRFHNSVCTNVVLTRRGGGGGGGEGAEGAGWNNMCLYIILITWVSSSSLDPWCCTMLCAVGVIRPWYMFFKAVWRLFLMEFCGLFVALGLLDVACFALYCQVFVSSFLKFATVFLAILWKGGLNLCVNAGCGFEEHYFDDWINLPENPRHELQSLVCYCSWKSVALLLLTDPIGSLGTVEMGTGQTTGVSRYIKGVTLGEGTYGVVFKAIDRVVQYCLLKASNLAMVT